MKTRIIKIGNSQGIRIPKVFLEQSGLGEEVELEVQERQIVIRSAERARQGWEEAFFAMTEHEDDRLLDEDLTGQTRWDENQWQW
jgi:antitoxin MazE